MANNGAVTKELNTLTTSYTIPKGYHSGAGTVSITTEAKTATPTKTSQVIAPTEGKITFSAVIQGATNNTPVSASADTAITITFS